MAQILWLTDCRSPDTAKTEDKMIYASTKDNVKNAFQGIGEF